MLNSNLYYVAKKFFTYCYPSKFLKSRPNTIMLENSMNSVSYIEHTTDKETE